MTNAKYLVEQFKGGLRLCRGEADKRLISSEEVEKCLLETTVGPKGEEMKRNALKWKEAAEVAVAEGGSSDRNIQDFVAQVMRVGKSMVNVMNINS